MAKWENESNPFALLGIEWVAENNTQPPTIEEVKKAYRRQAKEKHPDKNPDNPNAKDEFDLIKKAHDFLLDEHKFNVYIAELRSKAFQFSKRKSQKASRRKMMEDLEQREDAFVQALKRQKTQQQEATEKLNEVRERLQKQMQQQKEWLEQTRKKEVDDDVQDQLKRTFKVTWDRRCGEYTGQQLRHIFQHCGEISDIVVTTAKKKKGSALIIMKSEESLNKVQSQGAFGDIENPLLIVLGDKNKKHGQPSSSQNMQKPFSLRHNGFGFSNSVKQPMQFESCYNSYSSQQKQQQQQQAEEQLEKKKKGELQQENFEGQPLFPLQNVNEETAQQQNQQWYQQQFAGSPLFPVGNGVQRQKQFSQDNQNGEDDSVWRLNEEEEPQFEQQHKTSPLFPIQ
eukprot:TRINITY_DN4035_c1_g1_i1.p1 TRINITY_DN4035_c1_g1~~TRINITY_DN4035_c1_g1_i1.p1  ORF type:complete len:410 (-),score=66.18 TRINITY_DN4035_c1_g1_i1:141-1331(-)